MTPNRDAAKGRGYVSLNSSSSPNSGVRAHFQSISSVNFKRDTPSYMPPISRMDASKTAGTFGASGGSSGTQANDASNAPTRAPSSATTTAREIKLGAGRDDDAVCFLATNHPCAHSFDIAEEDDDPGRVARLHDAITAAGLTAPQTAELLTNLINDEIVAEDLNSLTDAPAMVLAALLDTAARGQRARGGGR